MELIPVAFANSLVARLDNLLIRNNGEGTLENKGVLLIHWSRKPELHSTRTRKCHPHGFPFLRHLENADEHVEVLLETSYGALAPLSEASRNIDDASDPPEIWKSRVKFVVFGFEPNTVQTCGGAGRI